MKKRRGFLTLLFTAGLLAAMPVSAFADAQKQLDAAQDMMNATKSEVEEAQERIQDLQSQKSEAETYLTDLQEQLTDLTEELDSLQTKYEDKQYQLGVLEEQLQKAGEEEATQREAMAKRIQFIYESSSGTGTLDALFSSESFVDFLNRADQFSELTSFDRDMLEEYGQICVKIEEQEAEVKEEKEAIEDLQEAAEKKKQELSALYEETSASVEEIATSLAGEQSGLAQLLQSVQKQESVIYALANRVQEEKKAQQQASSTAPVSSSATGGNTAAGSDAQTVSTAVSGQQSSVTQTTQQQPAQSGSSESGTGGTDQNANSGNTYTGSVLTKQSGVNYGPSGKETYYNLDMSGVVSIMRSMGNTDEYWVRSDGVKMLGNYVMVAANLNKYPRGTILPCSLGMAIVCDTGGFAAHNDVQLDIATAW